MSEQRRLGRGLEALLSQSYQPIAAPDAPQIYPAQDADGNGGGDGHDGGQHGDAHYADPAHATGSVDSSRDDGIVFISVHDVTPNRFQPRQDFNESELAELAESIRQHGVIQPIVVRRVDDGENGGGRIELISGERRLRAAILAGWAELPCWIRQADDRQVAEIAIVENVQRKDLNPLEKAASFQSYLDTYGCTKEELAVRVQIDRSTVANLVRLLELPDEVQQLIRGGLISQSHARALLPLGDEWEQITISRRILEEQLSVREVEDFVTEIIRRLDDEQNRHHHQGHDHQGNSQHAEFDISQEAASIVSAGNAGEIDVPRSAADSPKPKSTRRSARSSHIASLEQQLRTALGTKVEIREAARRRGRGQIIVHFSNPEEFERLHRYLVEQSTALPHSEAG
ncbi:MAG: ParB/RepB/Spo0J family partition protein [Pirellulales bacterium]